MKHILFELRGCPKELLDDEENIRLSLHVAAASAKSELLNISAHKFDPQGVTGLAMLADSHISIHTWPEKNLAMCDICAHWRFKTPKIALKSSQKIFEMYLEYRDDKDFIGMDMCRKFLEMGFTRSRRYANHRDGKKYDKEGNVIPQEPDHATCHFAKSATIFKKVRDIVAKSDTYVKMRKEWRSNE